MHSACRLHSFTNPLLSPLCLTPATGNTALSSLRYRSAPLQLPEYAWPICQSPVWDRQRGASLESAKSSQQEGWQTDNQGPNQCHPPVCRYGAHPSSQDWASVSVRVPGQAGAQAQSMQALLRQLPEQVFPAAGSWGVHQASRMVAAGSLCHPLALHAQQLSVCRWVPASQVGHNR